MEKMKKSILFVFVLAVVSQLIFAQGAGRALYFDGDNDYISLPEQEVGNLIGYQFTIEFWVNPGEFADRPTFGFFTNGPYNRENPISSYDSGLSIGDGAEFQLVQAFPIAPANTWTHYAVVDDGSHYNVYINGFLEISELITIDPYRECSLRFVVGTSGFASPYGNDFKGYFDEFRIWDIGFDADKIMENMCKKITPDHPNYEHLKCCLRFDESSGTVAQDISSNNNDGTMTGMDASIDTIWSGVPIGDDAVYDASGNNPGQYTVTLAHPQGDLMMVKGDGGVVTSIHLYRVDDTAMREDATKPEGWTIDNSRFWGVFITGTNPTYRLRYCYGQHGGITNENDLILAFREDNHDNSWENSNALQNLDESYFELTNQNGTEYALASENGDNPLPITLAVFSVYLYNSKPLISWTTQSESNIQGWNIYRSQTEYEEEAIRINGNIIPGAGTPCQPTKYEFTDEFLLESGLTYFYWLECVEFSGITNNFGPVSYSAPEEQNNDPNPPEIAKYGLLQNYPNPFTNSTTFSFTLNAEDAMNAKIEIFNIKGEKIKELFPNSVINRQPTTIFWDGKDENNKPVSGGIYLYRLKTDGFSQIKKAILAK